MPPLQTVFNGTESVKFLEQKIWELASVEMKQLESLREFRNINININTTLTLTRFISGNNNRITQM